MSKDFIYDLGFAINKCIRHSEFLEISQEGWCYLTDVGYIIWSHPTLYNHRSKHRRPAGEEMRFAMELTKPGRFHVSAVNMNDRLEHNIMLKPAQGHSGR